MKGAGGEEEILVEREDARVRHTTALQCVDTLLDYVEQWDFNYSDIVALRVTFVLV